MFPEYSTAAERAKNLMKEEFFFNAADDQGPFGNDIGALAWEAFDEWRTRNREIDPVSFVGIIIDRLGYPRFDLEESDLQILQPYFTQNNLAARYIQDTDSAILSIAFGQLYLEGTISPALAAMADNALDREWEHGMLAICDSDAREERREKLVIMQKLVEQVMG